MLWILSAFLSTASTWMVLHRKINDGIIAKTFLSLSVISGSVFLLNPCNANALIGNLVLFAVGFGYFVFHNRLTISQPSREHRRPF